MHVKITKQLLDRLEDVGWAGHDQRLGDRLGGNVDRHTTIARRRTQLSRRSQIAQRLGQTIEVGIDNLVSSDLRFLDDLLPIQLLDELLEPGHALT